MPKYKAMIELFGHTYASNVYAPDLAEAQKTIRETTLAHFLALTMLGDSVYSVEKVDDSEITQKEYGSVPYDVAAPNILRHIEAILEQHTPDRLATHDARLAYLLKKSEWCDKLVVEMDMHLGRMRAKHKKLPTSLRDVSRLIGTYFKEMLKLPALDQYYEK